MPKRTITSRGIATVASACRAFSSTKSAGSLRNHGADVFHRQIALTRHHRGIGQHVRGYARCRRSENPWAHQRPCDSRWSASTALIIGIDGLQPLAGANVDMRRHMHVVSKAGL